MSKLLDIKFAKLQLDYEKLQKDTSTLTALREQNYQNHVAKWVGKYQSTITHISYTLLDHKVR